MQNINIRDNPKKAWGLISAIDGKNATKGSIGPLQDPQGNLVTADQDKADLLTQQYYHVSSDQNLDPVFLEKRNERNTETDLLTKRSPPQQEHYNIDITLVN